MNQINQQNRNLIIRNINFQIHNTEFKRQVWEIFVGKFYEIKCPVSWCEKLITSFSFHIGFYDVPNPRTSKSINPKDVIPMCRSCCNGMNYTISFEKWNSRHKALCPKPLKDLDLESPEIIKIKIPEPVLPEKPKNNIESRINSLETLEFRERIPNKIPDKSKERIPDKSNGFIPDKIPDKSITFSQGSLKIQEEVKPIKNIKSEASKNKVPKVLNLQIIPSVFGEFGDLEARLGNQQDNLKKRKKFWIF
jgi:hypothetical protein